MKHIMGCGNLSMEAFQLMPCQKIGRLLQIQAQKFIRHLFTIPSLLESKSWYMIAPERKFYKSLTAESRVFTNASSPGENIKNTSAIEVDTIFTFKLTSK